jgi:hypothetical protein
MATITQFQTGPWSDTDTWIGGVVPGDGDLVVRGAGMSITVDVDTTVGTDAEGGWSISGGDSDGSIIIDDGVTLSVRSGIRVAQTYNAARVNSMVMFGDSVLDHIGTHANVFRVIDGDTALGVLQINGTAGHPATIRSTGTGGTFNVGTYWCLQLKGSYLNLENILATEGQDDVDIDHWYFDADCGPFRVKSIAAGKVLDIDAVTHKGTGQNFILGVVANPSASQTRTIKNLICYDTLYWGDESSSVTWDGLQFGTATGGSGHRGNIKNSILNYYTIDSDYVDTIKDSYLYQSGDNPHYAGNCKEGLDGCIFEAWDDYTSDIGDCVLVPTETVTSLYVKNCIELPNGAGRGTGTMITMFGWAGLTVEGNNNTFFTGPNCGETYNGHAGLLAKWYNNLCYNTAGYLVRFQSTGNAEDLVTDADCNSAFGTTDPYDLIHNANKYLATPGANDLNTDPALRAPTRDLASWAASLGSVAATEALRQADAITYLKARNDPADPNYKAGATPQNLCSYIRWGFAPTNPDYATAGKGGDYPAYIGAVFPVTQVTDSLCFRNGVLISNPENPVFYRNGVASQGKAFYRNGVKE